MKTFQKFYTEASTYNPATLSETLKKVNGKWAIVSKSNPEKVLQYYDGEGVPSEDWIKKVERRVQYFKHINK